MIFLHLKKEKKKFKMQSCLIRYFWGFCVNSTPKGTKKWKIIPTDIIEAENIFLNSYFAFKHLMKIIDNSKTSTFKISPSEKKKKNSLKKFHLEKFRFQFFRYFNQFFSEAWIKFVKIVFETNNTQWTERIHLINFNTAHLQCNQFLCLLQVLLLL